MMDSVLIDSIIASFSAANGLAPGMRGGVWTTKGLDIMLYFLDHRRVSTLSLRNIQ